jgi:hypothetical protein
MARVLFLPENRAPYADALRVASWLPPLQLRAVPACALTFVTYEHMSQWMKLELREQ